MNSFLPYINFPLLRLILFYGIRFTLPAIILAAFMLVIWVYVRNNKKQLLKREQSMTVCQLSIIPITLVISYTFTLVTAEISQLVSRNIVPFFTVGMIALILLFKNKSILENATRKMMIGAVLSLLLLLPFISTVDNFMFAPAFSGYRTGGLTNDSLKLKSAYVIPTYEDPIINITQDHRDAVPLLGEGFGRSSDVYRLVDFGVYADVLRSNNIPLAISAGHALVYYASDIAVSGIHSSLANQNRSGQESLIRQYEKDRPVLMGLLPARQYYIFRFVMDADYVKVGDLFVPVEHAHLFELAGFSVASLHEARSFEPVGLGEQTSEFGASFDLLTHLFHHDKTLVIEELSGAVIGAEGAFIEFDTPVNGSDFDALYIELELIGEVDDYVSAAVNGGDGLRGIVRNALDMIYSHFSPAPPIDNTPVFVRWLTADGMPGEVVFDLGDGKLLVQLGVNSMWLLSDISELSFQVGDALSESREFRINDMLLLSTVIN